MVKLATIMTVALIQLGKSIFANFIFIFDPLYSQEDGCKIRSRCKKKKRKKYKAGGA